MTFNYESEEILSKTSSFTGTCDDGSEFTIIAFWDQTNEWIIEEVYCDSPDDEDKIRELFREEMYG